VIEDTVEIKGRNAMKLIDFMMINLNDEIGNELGDEKFACSDEFDDELDKLDDELGNELEELEVLSYDSELINDELDDRLDESMMNLIRWS
jgi:hypothetical protein